MKTVTLELRLTVEYIPNGVPIQDLKANLTQLVEIGMGNGLLTGDSPAEVKTHYYEIEGPK